MWHVHHHLGSFVLACPDSFRPPVWHGEWKSMQMQKSADAHHMILKENSLVLNVEPYARATTDTFLRRSTGNNGQRDGQCGYFSVYFICDIYFDGWCYGGDTDEIFETIALQEISSCRGLSQARPNALTETCQQTP